MLSRCVLWKRVQTNDVASCALALPTQGCFASRRRRAIKAKVRGIYDLCVFPLHFREAFFN